MEQKKDGRRGNNQSASQRRAAISRRRKKPKVAIRKDRLEAAKNVLRRGVSEVFDAELCDPRFKGLIYVGTRKYTPEQVIDMAADVLAREGARNRELRSLYRLDLKRKK